MTQSNTQNNMRKFKITFGKGKDAVNVIEKGMNLIHVLTLLQRNGWSIGDVTKTNLITD